MSKILCLPLKAKWYDMHEKGIKPEDYREIKPYWIKRLINTDNFTEFPTRERLIDDLFALPKDMFSEENYLQERYFKKFDAVKFSYGYTKRTMTFECKGITIGKGNPEWGAPKEYVFIIKRGRRIG